jgi:POT family proton-dependent oligopeptide transporter
MLLGLLVFMWGKPLLNGKGESQNPEALRRRVAGLRFEWLIYLLALGAVAGIWLLIQYQGFYGQLLLAGGTLLLLYVLWQASRLEKDARERLYAVLFLIALQPVFWGLFEQAGGSINLFTDRYVDRGGVPASIFQSINPIYIILLGPLFAGLWTWLGRRGWEPSTPAKFGLALVQVGFSFILLVWGANSVGPAVLVPVIFIFLLYLFQTTGELCLSPVGLSAMNRLAPATMASLIMGAWFYASAGGNFVAGLIGQATGGETGEMTREGALAIYSQMGWITIGVGVAVLLVAPFVKKLMHLETLRDEEEPVLDATGTHEGARA